MSRSAVGRLGRIGWDGLRRSSRRAAPWVFAAAVLAVATYLVSRYFFEVRFYAGQSAGGVFDELAKRFLWLTIWQQAALVLAHALVYLVLLLWVDGLLLGLHQVAKPCRRRRRRWPWRVALALVANGLVLMEAMVRYPALFEDHFYQAGGLRRAIQQLAIAVGPHWLLPLALPLFGYALYVGARLRWRQLRLAIPLLTVLAALGLFFQWRRPGPRPATSRPNLLVIACDSLRADRINERTAPTLTRLRRQGVFFPELRISLARTATAWTSLLTGQWPIEHGVRHMFPTKPEREAPRSKLFARFVQAGYRSFVVGDFGSELFADIDFGFAYRDVPRADLPTLLQGRFIMTQPTLLPYLTLPYAADFFPAIRLELGFNEQGGVTRRLRRALAQRPRGRPFAGVAIYSATHFPFAAVYPYTQRLSPYVGKHRFSKRELLYETAPSAADMARTRELYDVALRMFDDQLARVLAILRESELLAHTVLVVMGDHGEELYDDGQSMAHGDHLRGRSNVTPLLFYGPSIQRRRRPVRWRPRDVDWATTVAELFTLPTDGLGGTSFAAALHGEPFGDEKPMYYETGVWLSPAGSASWQRRRLYYPDLSEICEVAPDGRIVLKATYRAWVISAKHRAMESSAGRLVYEPTLYGALWTGLPRRSDRQRAERLWDQRAQDLRRQLVRFTEALGEPWIGGRVLPRRAPGWRVRVPVEQSGGWQCELRLTHDRNERAPGHYEGRLSFDRPIAFAATGAEMRDSLNLDVRLQPGQQYSRRFWMVRPLAKARLTLRLGAEALTATDLFTGRLNLRPFVALSELDLERHLVALVDRGGFHEPVAVWLGCRPEGARH